MTFLVRGQKMDKTDVTRDGGRQMNASAISITPSDNQLPHFEEADGKKILYVDGLPFIVLTVEIPWWDLLLGHKETMSVYDYLYPAAAALGMNAIKVPVKWSLVEPQKGVYDFSYVDHVLTLARENGLKVILGWFGHYASGDGNIYRNLSGEVFAPMYVIEDDVTYPKAVDGDGVCHHNSISYDYQPIVDVETRAFCAFMEHVRNVDGEHTVVMIQIENEVAVFGADRKNRKMWRDHSPASEDSFKSGSFQDDLQYSAWSLTTKWLRPLTDAGKKIYPIPFFVNFVGGQLTDWMVGGSPGEDVATYLENCPALDFCGLNLYVQPGRSINDLRGALARYRVGRNLPCITEANSDLSRMAPRMAFVSTGEFGSPIFAPWALNVSYPAPYQPYVTENGTIANGGYELRDCYQTLGKILAPVARYGGTERLKVFMAIQPEQKFSDIQDLGGCQVSVQGQDNSQAIVIYAGNHEYIAAGYRCVISVGTDKAKWPELKNIRVEEGHWAGCEWVAEGENRYSIEQSNHSIEVTLTSPAVVRIWS